MIKKLALFIVVLTFLAMPFVSMAQSTGKSIQNLSAADVADDSIVVLSKEESGVPGYARQQYAVNCFGELQVIDYYGAPLDPKDQQTMLTERRMCARLFYGDDTDQD
jgi:hypothetical protein